MNRLRIEVERGKTGLWYVTSPDVKGLLVAAKTRIEAEHGIPQALYELLIAERAESTSLRQQLGR